MSKPLYGPGAKNSPDGAMRRRWIWVAIFALAFAYGALREILSGA